MVLSGSVNGSGFDDGIGQYAGFFNVMDMIQINNGSEVIIADGNHCVRKLNRTSNTVTTIAGICGNVDGLLSHEVPAGDAAIFALKAVIANEEKQELYYLCNANRGLLARHNLTSSKYTKICYNAFVSYPF